MEQIERVFKNRRGEKIGEYRESSVMFLLKEIHNEVCICFEVRSSKLRHQPGDICLPGGRLEVNETPLEAAIRETKEELNIEDKDICYIGEMDYFISPFNTIIYAFVSKTEKYICNPNEDEVDHIFWVPIKYLMENPPEIYDVTLKHSFKENFPFHRIKGEKDYKFSEGKLPQYFYKFNQYTIWGFTAKIVKNFVDKLSNLIGE